jgi:16S rRNA U1498 N3-methylase RsmE
MVLPVLKKLQSIVPKAVTLGIPKFHEAWVRAASSRSGKKKSPKVRDLAWQLSSNVP